MKLNSVKRNFIFNLLRNISTVLFAMVTFPYLSRVLEPSGIGRINFANSVIQYFVTLSSLGLPLYGTREIAKIRDDKIKLNIITNELFQISVLSTLISYLLFMGLYFINPTIQEDKILFFICSLLIIFTNIGVEWFYQGIEKYDYITKRILFVRLCSILFMFLFVKTKDDYVISASITVIGLIGANLFNLIKLHKYTNINLFKKYDLSKHIKPLIIIFGMNIATSIYLNLDSVMLGFFVGNDAVGIYTAAIKMNKLVLTIITSLGVVLIPRLSNYIKNARKKEYRELLEKALNIIVLIAVPSMIGLFLIANDIVILFSGEGFRASIITMKIICPIILFISLTNFLGIQVLYPLNKEKIVLFSVVIGAITNFILNLVFIPLLKENGAAIATVIAEFLVLMIQIIFGRKYLSISLIDFNKIKYIFSSIIMGFCIFYIQKLFCNSITSVVLSILTGMIIYVTLLFIVKDKIINEVIAKILRRKSYV